MTDTRELQAGQLGMPQSSLTRPSAGVGSVPCNFVLTVHEATQVPTGIRSLSVAWRKGVKEVSTGMVEVVNGSVAWERTIPICSLLFQGAEADGKVVFEAKFCWLEVTRDGGQVLGHAQLDLAEFCDGQVHERVLQVWKTAGSAGSAGLESLGQRGNLRIRVSVEANGLRKKQASQLPMHQTATSMRKKSVSDFEGMLPQTLFSPQETCAQPHKLSEADVVLPDLETLLRSMPPEHVSPLQLNLAPKRAHQTRGMRALSQQSGSPAGGSSPSNMYARFGTISAHGTILTDLTSRLLALCSRQCLSSGLSSMQQEDALALFISALRRGRDSMHPSGIIFSTCSHPAMVAQAAERPAKEEPSGAAPLVGSRSASAETEAAKGQCAPSIPMPAANEPDANTQNAGMATELPGPGAVPSLTIVGTAATAPDSTSLACTRRMYELLSHLSDIRSLATATLQAPPPPITIPHAASANSLLASAHSLSPNTGDDEAFGAFSTPSPLGREISTAAATFVEAASGEDPRSRELATPSGADASAGSPPAGGEHRRLELQIPDPKNGLSEAAAGSSAEAPASSSISPHSIVPQAAVHVQPPAMPAHVMVRQIVIGVDQAASIGEQVIKDVSAELGGILLQLGDVARDRELWAHRFLANRELQQSCMLCEQAAQLDRMGFNMPVTA